MTNNPKILYIIGTTHVGGAPIQAYWLAKNLKNKWGIFVVAPNDGPYFQKFRDLRIKTFNISVRQINPLLWLSIANIVRQNKIDLIHSHGKAAGLHSRLAGWITKTPVVHTFHGIHFKKYGIFSWIYLSVERILSNMTKFFIAVAEHEKTTAITMRFAKPQQIKVIYNAVPEYQQIRQQAHNNLFTLISVGRFYPGKGQEYLISAIPEVLKQIPTIKLLLIGDGSELLAMKALVLKLGIQNNVEFIKEVNQEELHEYLHKATIYVAPSLGEGLPLIVLEAGQAGLPVIATNVSGNNEIIKDNTSGLLVPATDHKALTQAIIRLHNNPQLAKECASNLQRTIKNKFGFNKMINETHSLYQKALNQDA